jgi:hypothetical protein
MQTKPQPSDEHLAERIRPDSPPDIDTAETKMKGCPYTSRLQKGGALLGDMRLLVRSWTEGDRAEQQQRGIVHNILGKRSRSRAVDTYRRAFVPRFIQGDPPGAWRIARPVEDSELPVEAVRPIYYWITARSEPLLYDFVTEELFRLRDGTPRRITTEDVAHWISAKLAAYRKSWSPTVTLKVARGLLATLRDFHILQGASHKRIAPVYLPVETFAYLALAIYLGGVTAYRLANHPDWRLFLLSPDQVERLFLEAHQEHLLWYQAAGRIIRIEFAAESLQEMAHVIASRTHR